MKDTLIEFRQFLMRGNIIELAVAFVLGLAFAALVTSVVDHLFTPLIGAIFGEPNFAALDFTINESIFRYGSVLNEVFSFLAIAAAIFFFVVKPVQIVQARMRSGDTPPPEPTEDVALLREIRDLLAANRQ